MYKIMFFSSANLVDIIATATVGMISLMVVVTCSAIQLNFLLAFESSIILHCTTVHAVIEYVFAGTEPIHSDRSVLHDQE
jgi:hypothetical protein